MIIIGLETPSSKNETIRVMTPVPPSVKNSRYITSAGSANIQINTNLAVYHKSYILLIYYCP